LTDEEEFDDAAEKQDRDDDTDEDDEGDVRCTACGADEFRVRVVKGASAGMKDERKLVCGRCGALAGS
jgi:DNA-directed RNA polymerase subunit M/transcription elongation factor TFIIS